MVVEIVPWIHCGSVGAIGFGFGLQIGGNSSVYCIYGMARYRIITASSEYHFRGLLNAYIDDFDVFGMWADGVIL